MTKGKNRCRDQESEEKQTKKAKSGLIRMAPEHCPPLFPGKVPANAQGGRDKPKVMSPQNHKT